MKNWPADKIERRSVDALIPYARNARTHSDEQVAQIAASIKEWGWTTPVLIDEDGEIIAGHGRVMAARKLGIEEVPTMVATGWTKAQKQAYVLADNQLPQNAGWDMDLLTVEMKDLDADGFDLSLIGFGDDMLANMLVDETVGLTDEDAVPDVPENPVTVLGDVWLLGNHRLICGDSTNADDVAKCLNGVEPHLMVTDPPYGVEYDPQARKKTGAISNAVTGKVLNDDNADWSETWALFPGEVAYVWHAGTKAGIVADSLQGNGFKIRSQIIWIKAGHILGRGDYHPMHEPCWYAVKDKAHWNGARNQDTVWKIAKQRAGDDKQVDHPTQKPVECMKRPIENNSSPGQAVYEPFSGSGTTIIAGEMTGRAIYAMELSPAYVDVAVKRWCEFTGKDATLETNGKSFSVLEKRLEADAA